MKIIKLLLLCLLINSSCHMQSKNGEATNMGESSTEHKETVDTASIKSIIIKEYPNARNIIIASEFLSKVSLFWSDPGYVEGPTISVNATCWKISFSTDNINDDGSIKYTDDNEYYVLKEDDVTFKRNRYHGKGYHGGSFVVLKNEVDFRYNEIEAPLVSSKDNMIINIESVLKK